MRTQTNFIDDLFPSIRIERKNASEEQLPLAVTGSTWIVNFYLAKGHPCLHYLRMHLQRKEIDFALGV